jgi:phosphatidylglycerol---prolipoprotein diacylglyceryl transferase
VNPVVGIWLGSSHLYVTSYRLFMVLAAVATIGIGFVLACRRGLPGGRTLACLVAMAGAVPVGARLLDLATKPGEYATAPWRLWSVDLIGFSMYGGLLSAALVGTIVCLLLRVDLVVLADSVAPALGVGIALMRVGCFEAGCCFGTATDLPWGVTFPQDSSASLHQLLAGGITLFGWDVHPVHPTQLYEAAAALAGTGMALSLSRRRPGDGNAFLAFVAWYSGFRLLNDSLRVPGAALAVPEWFYPAAYGGIALVALAALVARNGGFVSLLSRGVLP